jgi:hypothetical protein
MPRILTKLRVDEISAVDRAANDGAKIVLSKRGVDERPSFYQQLFSRKRAVRKATYRGAIPGRHLRNIDNLTPAEARHFLIHDAHGRQLLRDVGGDIDTLADNLVAASARVDAEDNPRISEELSSNNNPDNSDEENSMTKSFDAVAFAKRVVDDGITAISEAQAFELVQKFASDHRLPNEKPAAAFARIYGADDDIGLSFRKMITIAKGHAHPHVGA